MRLTLETERLILRPWCLDDAEDMFFGWANDEEVTRYMTWNPHNNVEETKALLNMWITEYEKPERLNFAIVLKDNNQLIGGIDVVGYIDGPKSTPIIGYNLSKKYWNNGYMTEACLCLINYLFSKGYEEIRIDAAKDNIASNRVIIKCGGIFIKSENQYFPLKNKTLEINHYILKRH